MAQHHDLAAQQAASLGHQLGPWKASKAVAGVDAAECSQCKGTVWARPDGILGGPARGQCSSKSQKPAEAPRNNWHRPAQYQPKGQDDYGLHSEGGRFAKSEKLRALIRKAVQIELDSVRR